MYQESNMLLHNKSKEDREIGWSCGLKSMTKCHWFLD